LKKIPANLVNAFREAMAEATKFQRTVNAQEEEQTMELLKKNMQVNNVPAETLKAYRDAAQSVYAPAIAQLGPDGEGLVADIVKANS
jgi:TRAP-type C4-dicarboxylate transport system substrate-binding protein